LQFQRKGHAIEELHVPEQFGAFIGQERAKWGKVIRQAKIRVE